MNAENLLNTLPQFTGTIKYYRWSGLFPKCLLTDGTKYLAENAECFWLMDVIASHLRKYGDTFGVARLVKTGDTATFFLEDGNDHVIAKQEIEYTDFPLPSIVLYVTWDTMNWTIMLPSEY